MTIQAVADLKAKFESGDMPTGQDYIDLIDTLLDIESQWPATLAAADGSNLTNLTLPDPLPALDAEALFNLIPNEWVDLSQYNSSYADSTSFVITGDHTERFVANKLIRLTVAGNYEYTTPESAVYDSTPDVTTVTINNAMSDVTLTAVDVSVFSPFNSGGAISPEMIGVFVLHSITASVESDALTVGIPAATLKFRSTELTDGAPASRSFADLSLVVPSGATLGTADAVKSRLYLLAIDNGGGVEPAIVNVAGGVNLDETTLISTTAIDATADSNNLIYSTTARNNVPFRVVGFVESTQATAGIWSTSPSLKQGAGGNALKEYGHDINATGIDIGGGEVLFPDGTIFGSNANGKYTKHPNGNLICYKETIVYNSIGAGSNIQGTWTFPHTYEASEDPTVTLQAMASTPGSAANHMRTGIDNGNPSKPTGVDYAVYNKLGSAASGGCDGVARGRWK